MWPRNPFSKWREDFPLRDRGQIVLFCYANTAHGAAAERSLKTSAFWPAVPNLTGFVCLTPENKQLFVKVLWKYFVSCFIVFFEYFQLQKAFL